MTRQSRRSQTSSKTLYGISGLDANTYLASSDPPGLAGDVGGFWVGAIVRFGDTSDNNYLVSNATGSEGWALSFASGLCFSVLDDGSVQRYSPAGSITTGKVYAVTAVYTGSALRLYLNGSQVGSETVITGYSPRNSGVVYIGGGGAMNGYLDFFGLAYGTGVPTDSQVLDWYLASRHQRRVVSMAGVTTARLWRPGQSVDTMTDLIGGAVTLTPAGTGSSPTSITSPDWGG